MNTNQRVIISKRMLQEAMLQLLKEKPIDKIRVTELCEKAGINRATFYRHYQLPKDILNEMQCTFVKNVQREFETEALVLNPEQFMEALCTYLYDNRDYIAVFLHSNMNQDVFGQFKEPFRELVYHHISKRKYEIDEEGFELLCAYIAGGSYFMINQWLLGDIKKTPQEAASFILGLMKVNNAGDR